MYHVRHGITFIDVVVEWFWDGMFATDVLAHFFSRQETSLRGTRNMNCRHTISGMPEHHRTAIVRQRNTFVAHGDMWTILWRSSYVECAIGFSTYVPQIVEAGWTSDEFFSAQPESNMFVKINVSEPITKETFKKKQGLS